jgi:hypothetical protein
MKNLIFPIIFILTAAVSASAQIKKCFVNFGLEDKHIVYLTMSNTKVSGEYLVEKGYEVSTNYAFSGTNSNNNLSISFAKNKRPYQFPPKAVKGVWAIKKVGDVESLQIQIYGRNYETNKYSTYFVTYDSCEPSYGTLAQKAKRITFAKGSNSAVINVVLQGQYDQNSFWLNLAKGQNLSVEAPGCGISFYYPNKTKYEEGTAIDMWGSESLPQSGDYLFVISRAGELNECTVKFTAK